MRSVFVDGSTKGRPERGLFALNACDDGHRAMLVAGAGSRTIRVWCCALDDGTLRLVYEAPDAEMVRVARDADRVFAVTRGEASLRWQDLATGRGDRVEIPVGMRLGPVSPSGRLVCLMRTLDASSSDVHLLRVADGKVLARVSCVSTPVFDDGDRMIVRTTRRELVTVSPDDGATSEVVRGMTLGRGALWVFAERRGHRLLLVNDSTKALVVDTKTGEIEKTLTLPGPMRVDDFASGKVLLRQRSPKRATHGIVDVATESLRTLDHEAGLFPVLTPDGATVLTETSALFVAIDVALNTKRPWHDGHEAPVQALVWSRDGSHVASIDARGAVRVSSVRASALAWAFESAGGEGAALAFSPDGRSLYCLGPQGLVVWDLGSGHESHRVVQAGHRVRGVAVAPDGRYLATAGEGMPPRVLDLVAGGRVVAKLDVVGESVAFALDGTVRVLTRNRGTALLASWFDVRGVLVRGPSRSAKVGPDYVTFDDDDGAALEVRREMLVKLDLRDGTSTALCGSLGCERVFCARSNVAVLAATSRVGSELHGVALVVVDLSKGGELGRVTLSQGAARVALAPDLAHVAVAYVDARVEVFALDIPGGLTARPSRGDGARAWSG